MAVTLSMSACGGGSNGGGTETVAPGENVQVSMKGTNFTPASISVKKGTTVTWSNEDSVDHTVTADKGAFNSDKMKNGVNFGYTFNEPGTFDYHCTIHPSMKGTVTVTE